MKIAPIKGASSWFSWKNNPYYHTCSWCTRVCLKKFKNCPRCGKPILKEKMKNSS
jgi:hypothetical protein